MTITELEPEAVAFLRHHLGALAPTGTP